MYKMHFISKNSYSDSFYFKFTSLFPKVFVTSVLTWSYYTLIFTASFENIFLVYRSPILSGLVDIIASLLYGICLYSYFITISTGPGSPLDYEELKINNINSLGNSHRNFDNPFIIDEDPSIGLLSHNEEEQEQMCPSRYMKPHLIGNKASAFRYCTKCSVWKPDRTHHCSSCQKCVLKMDHHCPWFATCIGFHNQKFFIQFLFYLTIYSGFVFIVTICLLFKYFTEDVYEGTRPLSIKLIVLFILGISFGVTLAGFTMFIFYIILKNKTTLEFIESGWRSKGSRNHFQYEFNEGGKKSSTNIFDLGYSKNWTSVMGDDWKSWFFPFSITSKDLSSDFNNGINFPVDKKIYEKWCNSAQLQEQLNQQLLDYKKRIRIEREQSSHN